MLALDPTSTPNGPAEQYGLDVLIDLSRLLRFTGQADAVRLRLVDDPSLAVSLESCVARRWYIEHAEAAVLIPRAVLRLVAGIAGAAREQQTTRLDRFGRVPSEVNELVSSQLERSPVLAQAALELRRAVLEVAGRRAVRLLVPWPAGRRWAVALSHDLDVVARWPVFTALRLLELGRKRDIRRVVNVFLAATRTVAGDPVWSGVRQILEIERAHAVRSTWFVLCGTPTFATMRAGDLTYLPESPAARRIISALMDAGHAVELHGSFQTYVTAERFREQRQRLATITGVKPNGVRQHYLRMRPGQTQCAMADAGFEHDSTFGFADRNGFRLGAADVVPAWSEADEQVLNLDELPFAWMDRALSKYRGIESPQAWIDDALQLAASARESEGVWCGIWHPNLTPALGFPEAPQAYAQLVGALAALEPLFETSREIVAWRRARRSATATAIAPDGSVVFHAPQRAERYPLALEDASGRTLPERPTG
jgi:peptidoglycan/xylan/chitin deacetylase (PgdA/CDA1 family)